MQKKRPELLLTEDAWSRSLAAIDARLESLNEELTSALTRFVESIAEAGSSLREASKRFAQAAALVSCELPRRGWYLSGVEPISFVSRLAERIEAEDWPQVDEMLLERAAQLKVDGDLLRRWLVQQGVPSYSLERVFLVLEACRSGDHSTATIVGVTVVDELCRLLYEGRDFTTKRGRQPKPQLAARTTSSRRGLGLFARDFVADFGLIHEDTKPALLDDEDYFNRAAILHGQMKRPYGPKDSAKVQLLLMFLICGADT